MLEYGVSDCNWSNRYCVSVVVTVVVATAHADTEIHAVKDDC